MNARFLLSVLTLACTVPKAVAQTPGAMETFSWKSNADSWSVYDWDLEQFYYPAWDLAGDRVNPEIYFTIEGSSLLDFFARATSSGGSFTGNLAAAGVDAVGCEVYLEDAAAFDFCEIYISTGSAWYFSITFPPATGWDFIYASFSSDTWFNEELQPVSLDAATLSAITEIGITFYPRDDGSANGMVVGIDNFTYYARLAAPPLTATRVTEGLRLDFPRTAGLAYSILKSATLGQNSWSPLPGQSEITGTTPYSFTAPITGDAGFFKVGASDFLTPVPQLAD
jgi:hypothetical protein